VSKRFRILSCTATFVVSGRGKETITMKLIDRGVYRLDNKLFQARYNRVANTWTLCEAEERGTYRVGSNGRLYEITYELQTGFYDIEQTPTAWSILDLESVHPQNDHSTALWPL
jgi:hypothetical protein